MKNISLSDERKSLPSAQQRYHAKVIKIEKAFCKAARQEAFIKSIAGIPVSEAISRAELIAKVNPSDFRIIHMPG